MKFCYQSVFFIHNISFSVMFVHEIGNEFQEQLQPSNFLVCFSLNLNVRSIVEKSLRCNVGGGGGGGV